MNLNRASRVARSLCGQVGRVRSFLRGEGPKVVVNTFNVNSRYPAGLALGDAHQSMLAVEMRAALVLLIDCLRNIAQVSYRVVSGVAVLMVDLSIRPNATHVQPREAMRPVVMTSNADLDVTSAVAASGARLVASLASWVAPAKYAGFWVVMKKFAQTLRGKIGLSHDAVLSLIGQRPARVDSTGGLRYFSGLHAVLHEPNCRHTHRQPSHLRVAFSLG